MNTNRGNRSWAAHAPLPSHRVGNSTVDASSRPVPPPKERAGTKRMSMGYFLHPNYDAEIAGLPTCPGAGKPEPYPPVRAGDMMRQKLEARAA